MEPDQGASQDGYTEVTFRRTVNVKRSTFFGSPGPFLHPRAVLFDPSLRSFLVSDWHHLRELNLAGEQIKEHSGVVTMPFSLAQTAEGRLLVCDYGEGRLAFTDRAGETAKWGHFKTGSQPADLAVGAERIYVVQHGFEIAAYTADGSLDSLWGSFCPLTQSARWEYPLRIAMTPLGLAVAEASRRRLLLLDPASGEERKIVDCQNFFHGGVVHLAAGRTKNTDLLITRDSILACDSRSGIHIFSQSLEPMGKLHVPALKMPMGLCSSPYNLWVCDLGRPDTTKERAAVHRIYSG